MKNVNRLKKRIAELEKTEERGEQPRQPLKERIAEYERIFTKLDELSNREEFTGLTLAELAKRARSERLLEGANTGLIDLVIEYAPLLEGV